MNLNIENNLFKFLHKSHISHPVQKNAFLWTKDNNIWRPTIYVDIWHLQVKNYTSAIRFKNPERVLPDIRAEPVD